MDYGYVSFIADIMQTGILTFTLFLFFSFGQSLVDRPKMPIARESRFRIPRAGRTRCKAEHQWCGNISLAYLPGLLEH